MKKLIIAIVALFTITLTASAQTTKTKREHTSTVPQKVHNVIYPHHKRYSGHKVKHKHHR